jgi:hypothetical protein
MILALYIIGSAFTILMLAQKLRDARRDLTRARWERDAYAAAIQSPPPASSYADRSAVDGRALPAGTTVSYADRRPEE